MNPEEDLRQGADLVERLAAAGRISPEESERLHRAMYSALEAGKTRFGAALSWIVAVLVSLLYCGQALLVFRLPAFRMAFAEMQRKGGLPLPTELLLVVPGWLQGLLLAGLAAAMIAKECLLESRRRALIISLVAVVLLLLYGIFFRYALFAPMLVDGYRLVPGPGQ